MSDSREASCGTNAQVVLQNNFFQIFSQEQTFHRERFRFNETRGFRDTWSVFLLIFKRNCKNLNFERRRRSYSVIDETPDAGKSVEVGNGPIQK